MRDITMICKSIVRFRHARRYALRQYFYGPVHVIVTMVDVKGDERSLLQAHAYRMFEKHATTPHA